MATALRLPIDAERPLRVLAIGAHADDIEIGCGGTLLSLVRSRPVLATWVVLCAAEPERAAEARASAESFLSASEGSEIVLGEFHDSYLPHQGAQVKDLVQGLAERLEPDLVFTHQRHDLHQDHRLLNELTWNAFRDQLILEYEIPKWDGDLGAPNVFSALESAIADEKVALLLEHFASQRSKDWFEPEVFRALMRLRGMECRAPSGSAEAFYGKKLSLDLS